MNPVFTSLLVLPGLLLGAYGISVLEQIVLRGSRKLIRAVTSPLAEAVALLRKENVSPGGADRFLFGSAPCIALASVALAALIVPVGPELAGFDPTIGLFYFIAILAPFVISMMNAGWSQNSKVGLFGTFRAAAHLISYEVPLGFAAIGPVMAAESLSTVRIIDGQAGLWYAVWQPLGLTIYLIAALFVTYRRPFELPQSGSELDGGVLSEYSGPKLLLFKISLRAILFLISAMGAVLFLGGWHGPLLPAPAWLLSKTFAIAAVLLTAGGRLPRLRHEQMLTLSWKVLLPASLVNVALVGIVMLLMSRGES